MRFEIWQSPENSQWYWHLKAANDEIVASGEGYRNEKDCLHAIGLVMDTNRNTPVYK